MNLRKFRSLGVGSCRQNPPPPKNIQSATDNQWYLLTIYCGFPKFHNDAIGNHLSQFPCLHSPVGTTFFLGFVLLICISVKPLQCLFNPLILIGPQSLQNKNIICIFTSQNTRFSDFFFFSLLNKYDL